MLKSLPLPKYHTVYLVLKERLRDGVYDVRVPGEMELMGEFSVSRATVRKALENLANEGLIERSAGRGTTRVLPDKPPEGKAGSNSRMTGLLDSIVARSLDTKVKVIEHERMQATERAAQRLALEARGEVLRAVRLRSTREGPVSHITTWVPGHLASHLGRRQLAASPLLVLLEQAGVEIGRATQSISARQADAQVAALLGVDLGSALLYVDRVVYDSDNRPIEWLQGLYRPDRYEYEMELSRVGELDAKVWMGCEVHSKAH